MTPIKIYCIKCNKFRKFESPKTFYISDETLFLSIICIKCGKNNEIILKEESIEILKIIGLNK